MGLAYEHLSGCKVDGRSGQGTYARSPRVLVCGCSPATTSAVVSMPSRTKPTNKSVSEVMAFSVYT